MEFFAAAGSHNDTETEEKDEFMESMAGVDPFIIGVAMTGLGILLSLLYVGYRYYKKRQVCISLNI